MAIEKIICPVCKGHGGYTLGPYPATRCNNCIGKGYIIVEKKENSKDKK